MKSRKRNRVRPRLAVEMLEARTMLDGNVLAVLDAAGNLRITGDRANNCVLMDQPAFSPAGTLAVTGAEAGGPCAAGTSINGVPLGTSTFSGVTGSVTVLGAAGDDLLTVASLAPTSFLKDLAIDMGTGLIDAADLDPRSLGMSDRKSVV